MVKTRENYKDGADALCRKCQECKETTEHISQCHGGVFFNKDKLEDVEYLKKLARIYAKWEKENTERFESDDIDNEDT